MRDKLFDHLVTITRFFKVSSIFKILPEIVSDVQEAFDECGNERVRN